MNREILTKTANGNSWVKIGKNLLPIIICYLIQNGIDRRISIKIFRFFLKLYAKAKRFWAISLDQA